MRYSEEDMQEIISEAIESLISNEDSDFYDEDMTTRTYDDYGMLTTNKGVVVKIGKQEFCLTIVEKA